MRENLLFGFQQVLDRYGMPDSATAFDGGMMYWTYDLGDGHHVNLTFSHGLLYRWDGD